MTDREGLVRILIADGQSLFREAMRAIIDAEADLRVVGEAGTGLQAVEVAVRTEPDVALLYAGLQSTDAIRTITLLRERVPGCRVMILASEEHHGTLAACVEAGASGFLTQGSRLADVLEATRTVSRGETVIPPGMLAGLLSRLTTRKRERDLAQERLDRLTHREREVLSLLARGADNETIGAALVISPHTARTHIQNILNKLGAHSRLEATAFFFRNGDLEFPADEEAASHAYATQGP
jgi:DNA-binding NarL/FixJ family response regulator